MSTGFLSAASAGADADAVGFFKPWREKFVGGEFDVFEHLARVIRSGDALFSGNAEIVCGNKHLHPSFQLNNGEKTKGNKHFLFSGFHKVSVKTALNTFRKVDAAGGTFAFAVFCKPAVKNDGGNHLNNCPWIISGHSATKRNFGTEHLYVAFASLKN